MDNSWFLQGIVETFIEKKRPVYKYEIQTEPE
jgi:hypothetical protein